MQVEIDQSGKVERTQVDTALAFASHNRQFTIFIPASVKREVLTVLRQRRTKRSKTKQHILVFAILMFILIKDHVGQIDRIIIDIEYQGNEKLIREHLINLCRRRNLYIQSDLIQFGLVGKRSRAHHAAIAVFRGEVKPDKVISAMEILAEL